MIAIVAFSILQGAVPAPARVDSTAVPEPAAFWQAISGTTLSIEFVGVPGGMLEVADGGAVAIAPFWMSATEIPWQHYDAFVFRFDERAESGDADGVTRPTKPYVLVDRGFGHDGYPAISMSHKGAVAFCEWLSAKTGRTYRLPSEHEWEWACRAGAGGEPETPLAERAWYAENAERKTRPVAKRKPNAWGLFDMLGNAAEWCTSADGQPIVCGGAYSDPAEDVTPRARKHPSPAWNAHDPQLPKSVWWLTDAPFVGLRVVCEEPPPEGERGEPESERDAKEPRRPR